LELRKNPGYEYYSSLQLKNGQLHVNFSTENQQISRIKFFGNTITVDAAEALEEVLLGTDLNDKTLETLLTRTIFGSNKKFCPNNH
jgi:Bacterial lipoate protein ligase C-terminus.